ncbi:MAG TPA: hypothetical protein VF992_10285 [Thermoplasmata archaeon]
MRIVVAWVLAAALFLSFVGTARAMAPPPTERPLATTPAIADGARDLSPDARTPAPAAANGPAAWRPFYNASGYARNVVVDGARGRILVTADFVLLNGSQAPALLVFNLAGTLQLYVSLPQDVTGAAHSMAIEPSTGDVFITTLASTIFRVDPTAGAILAEWPVSGDPDVLSYAAGALYTANVSALLKVSPSTGAILSSWDLPAHAVGRDLYVDASARWAFVSDDVYAYRIDLADGSRITLGSRAMFAPSADEARVFMLADSEGFREAWVSNGTIDALPVTEQPNLYSFRANPRTDVLAFAYDGVFRDPDNGTSIQLPLSFSDVTWTADGSALVGVTSAPGYDGSFAVGTWSGTPWIDAPNPWVTDPDRDPTCASIMSATMMATGSIQVTRDGAPYLPNVTWEDEVCFNLERNWGAKDLADGDHTARVTGLDRLLQSLDETVTFTTDTTPPAIVVTSPLETADLPYVLAGWVDELHPGSVWVGGALADLVGTAWSFPVNLALGNNSFRIEAWDAVENAANATVTIRYWPAHVNDLTNATEHFVVSVPPGWTGQVDFPFGAVRASAALIGPSESPSPAVLAIVTARDATLVETAAYAHAQASQAQAYIVSQGATIVVPVHDFTVDGHPAAGFEARVTIDGVPTRYVQTVVASAVWLRLYIFTFTVPESNWPRYQEADDWIFEGFRIEAEPPAEGIFGIPTWMVAAIAIGAAVAGAVAVLLWRRKRKGGPPAEPVLQEPATPGPFGDDWPPL